MKIVVGSANAAKVAAVKELLPLYPHLTGAEVLGIDVGSEVSAQPKGLDETIRGAIARAQKAWGAVGGVTYGIGLESGVVEVPHTKTGWMDTCACAIFDGDPFSQGRHFHIGLSSFWEAPKAVIDLMFKDDIEMTEACLRSGLTTNPKLGQAEGALGILSNGRLTRIDHCKQAIQAALIHIEPR